MKKYLNIKVVSLTEVDGTCTSERLSGERLAESHGEQKTKNKTKSKSERQAALRS